MALTATQVDAAKPGPRKRKLSDGGGLYLEVLPSGRKTFRLVYRFGGKQKDVRLGTTTTLRLAEARSRRDSAKAMIQRGEDPAGAVSGTRSSSSAQATTPRGEDAWDRVAELYLEYRRRRGGSWQTLTKLERHVAQTMEFFKGKPVGEVTASDILALVRPMEDGGRVESAHQVRTRCAQVLDYAEALGFPNYNPARRITGAMMPRKGGSLPGLTEPEDVGRLMHDIRAFQRCEPGTRWGLLLSAYLFPRSEQLRGATWDEIDLDAGLWETPGARMTGAGSPDHLVPLPRQAVSLLNEIDDYTGAVGYVVPSPRRENQKMSDMAFNMALRRMGYCTRTQHCHHGFSTTLNEMGYNRDWIERQLSHVERDNARSAYKNAQFIEARTRMMQAYADWLDGVEREHGGRD